MFVRSFVVVLLSTTALANAASFVVTERPQSQLAAPAQASAPGPAASAEAPKPVKSVVDESALRYYARHNEVDRMEAEIRRLRTLYPDWQVPDDLTSDKPYAGEEQPFWDLYTQPNKLAELDRAIAEKKVKEPGWEPSAELADKVKLKHDRAALIAAADGSDWNKVLDIAAAQPSLTDCTDVDVLWRLAEAYNGLSRANRSEDVYRFILNNCTVAKERLATVRKALILIGEEPTRRLMLLGAPGEFDIVNDDILALRLSNVVSGKAKDDLTDAEKKHAAEIAQGKPDYGFTVLLGWYSWAKADSKTALKWFQLAKDMKGENADPKVIEGVVLALHDLARDDEALKIAKEWHLRAPGIENLYIGLTVVKLSRTPPQTDVTEAFLKEFVNSITARKAANGASAMGWYAFNLKQYDTAENWFNVAIDWSPKEIKESFDAHMNGTDDARTALLIARLAANVAGTKSYDLSDEDRAKLEAAAKRGDSTITGLLGWYERKRGNINEALGWFQAGAEIPGQESNPEFVEGIVLCLHDLGKRDEAMKILNKWKDQSGDMMAIWAGYIAEGLTAQDQPVVVDPVEISQLATQVAKLKSASGANALGWYAFNLGQYDTSALWFKQSMLWEPSDAAAVGHILSAFRLGDKQATKDLAQTYSKSYPAVADLNASLLQALDPPKQSIAAGPSVNSAALSAKNRGDFSGCVSILNSKGSISPSDSLVLGWCYMELKQPSQALSAFEGALSGRGQVYSDAAYGKSLALLQLGMSNSAAETAASARLNPKQKREIGVSVLANQAVTLYNAGRYREALAVLDERGRYQPESTDLSMVRGWALYNLGYTEQARQVFSYVNSVFPSREAVQALNDISRH